MKKVLLLHGFNGYPSIEKAKLFEKRGYDVIYPHIDYIKYWKTDNCRNLYQPLKKTN